MFENKKIFIFGMAKSGYEAAKLLSKYNNEIIITDGKEQDPNHVKELIDLWVRVEITTNQIELIDNTFDYMIKNPGIPANNPVVLKAKELGIKIINEIEMAYHFLPNNTKIVGITGSNGKSTVTSLTGYIADVAHIKVAVGANFGVPVFDILSDDVEL